MEEQVIHFLSSPILHPFLILAIGFFFMFLENIFPPSPSDVVLLFLGSLVGFGKINFFALLAVSAFGSILGFVTMFYVGKLFGEKVIDEGKLRFIKRESIEKTRRWFHKYGYIIVVANRFLSGTRAVISFFAGFSELSVVKSTIFAGISAAVWNFLIIWMGVSLGKNWRQAITFLELYWKIILAILALFGLGYLVLKLIRKKSIKINNFGH